MSYLEFTVGIDKKYGQNFYRINQMDKSLNKQLKLNKNNMYELNLNISDSVLQGSENSISTDNSEIINKY